MTSAMPHESHTEPKQSEWFDYWASTPKLVKEARWQAEYAVAVRDLKRGMTALLGPVVACLDRWLTRR